MQKLLGTLRTHVTWTGYGFRVSCFDHQHAANIQQQLERSPKARGWTISWLRPPAPPQQDTISRRLNVNFSGASEVGVVLMMLKLPDPLQSRQLCFTSVAYFGATASMLTNCRRTVIAFVGPNCSEAATRFQAYHELGSATAAIGVETLGTMNGIWYNTARLPLLQSATGPMNPCWDQFSTKLDAGDTLGWYSPEGLDGHRDSMWTEACTTLLGSSTAVLACEFGVLAAFPRGTQPSHMTGWRLSTISAARQRPPPLLVRAPPCNYWALYADDAIRFDAAAVYSALMARGQPNARLALIPDQPW